MEDYHNLLNKRISEIYSIVKQLNNNDLSLSNQIHLRKQYIVVADAYLDILKLIEKKIEYGKERCNKHIALLTNS